MRQAGFKATAEAEEVQSSKRGDIVLVGNGGSVLFYVIGHDPAVLSKLVRTLEQSDFAGVIFTKAGGGGTFALSQAFIDATKAPDVVMSFRWSEEKNEFGAAGLINSDWNRKAGKGTHATLSPSDIHNTLIAAGPDFRHGATDDLPTGNVDIAPTVLRILKIKPAGEMDGRVLSEALVDDGDAAEAAGSETLDASEKVSGGTWHEWLRRSRVGRTIYLDAGNGEFRPGN